MVGANGTTPSHPVKEETKIVCNNSKIPKLYSQITRIDSMKCIFVRMKVYRHARNRLKTSSYLVVTEVLPKL